MVYRGVKYAIVKDIDVHRCWRWTFVVNDRRFGGQTKICSRAAEIQVRKAIDKGIGTEARNQVFGALAGALSVTNACR
jgi:hypothetical protein